LVHGTLDLHTGLVILILAPEAYLPLRQVGTQPRRRRAGRGPVSAAPAAARLRPRGLLHGVGGHRRRTASRWP
ncbi:hypothetical protein AB0B42_29570, partial [Streptomyces fradiae]|uniref:hypothetical protein n=1 Tax=Streptomyces fradiae TaxID=1906 RepID=UPI0033D26253